MIRGPVFITPNRAEHGPVVNMMVMLAMMEGHDPIVVSSDPDLAAAMAEDGCFFWALETGSLPDVYDREVSNCWRAWADHCAYSGPPKQHKQSGTLAWWMERAKAAAGARAFPDRLVPTFDAAGENPPGYVAVPAKVDDWEPPF
jgi:hypothetical protein